LEAASQEWRQQAASSSNTVVIYAGSTHFGLVGRVSLHMQFAHVFRFGERKEKYSLREILNEATNMQFPQPSYSKERNFQLLGKSRKNIRRGSESKCSFSFPERLQILPPWRRLQPRKPQGTAHRTVFLWETVTAPRAEHNQPAKAQPSTPGTPISAREYRRR